MKGLGRALNVFAPSPTPGPEKPSSPSLKKRKITTPSPRSPSPISRRLAPGPPAVVHALSISPHVAMLQAELGAMKVAVEEFKQLRVDMETFKRKNEEAVKEMQVHYEEQFAKLRASILPSIDSLTTQESLTRILSDNS